MKLAQTKYAQGDSRAVQAAARTVLLHAKVVDIASVTGAPAVPNGQPERLIFEKGQQEHKVKSNTECSGVS